MPLITPNSQPLRQCFFSWLPKAGETCLLSRCHLLLVASYKSLLRSRGISQIKVAAPFTTLHLKPSSIFTVHTLFTFDSTFFFHNQVKSTSGDWHSYLTLRSSSAERLCRVLQFVPLIVPLLGVCCVFYELFACQVCRRSYAMLARREGGVSAR
jgi:hypothetical protein